ncbi:MAG TPA: peptide ABC transporter substrate-binding protein [Candidatus Krumholzibacteria bacterium]|nr:peptide ABC transporter substrate-binding protein [Candidatus Krumholzibacteria bacterium]
MSRLYLLVLSACLAASSFACGTTDERTARSSHETLADADTSRGPVSGGRIVIGVQQEPEMLSEILNSMATNNMVCNLIFSKFVKYDDHFNLIPDLITEIPTVENGGVSADHRVYTYHLRSGVRWHDGRPLTSRDVRFTFDIIMDPKVNVESREGWEAVASLETPDDTTVVFRLQRPYPDFVGETFFDEPVLPEHLLRDSAGERFHAARFHRAPVGSGPFTFKSWTPGSHLELVANADYYGEGPYLDAIIFKFIPNENTLLVQLKTGEIDVFDNANINFMSQLEAIPGIRIYRTPMLMYEHLDLNVENPVLADRRVRRALSFATNKAEIAERIYNGLVMAAPLDEFAESRYYSPSAAERARFDLAAARRLLHEAGWRDTDNDGIVDRDGVPLKLTISASAGQPNRERTELVLREQYRAVGIDVEIRNYGPTVLYGTYEDGGILKRGSFDIAMYAWLSTPEPSRREALYSATSVPPQGQNHPRFRHDELTRLLEEGSTETDVAKREVIYQRVQEILVDEAPVIPLFWYTAIDPVTERLQNFRPNATQSADTWNAATWYLGGPQVSSR